MPKQCTLHAAAKTTCMMCRVRKCNRVFLRNDFGVKVLADAKYVAGGAEGPTTFLLPEAPDRRPPHRLHAGRLSNTLG